jgi:hypothetical protein
VTRFPALYTGAPSIAASRLIAKLRDTGRLAALEADARKNQPGCHRLDIWVVLINKYNIIKSCVSTCLGWLVCRHFFSLEADIPKAIVKTT